MADRVGKLSSGLQLSLAANFVDRELAGTQVTVGANLVRGPGRGLQLAVGANWATASFRGAQIATGLNVVHEDARGAQISSGANVAGARISGAQIAAVANTAGGDAHGAQITAGVNYASGMSLGAQIGAISNIVRSDSAGAQIAAGLNLATHTIRGAQIAGGANLAGTVDGMQLAPFNLAGTADGLQLGVVNLATRGRGFKIGVINLAREHDGEALGLINLIGNGIHSFAAYACDAMLSNLELKLGSRHLYTSFQFAYQPGDALAAGPARFEYGSRRYGFGLGLGYRQPLAAGRLRFLEIEASQISIRSRFCSSGCGFSAEGDNPGLASLRVVLGIEILRGLSGIVGISENAAIASRGRDLDIGSGFLEAVQHSGQTTVREYPGLLLGLQL